MFGANEGYLIRYMINTKMITMFRMIAVSDMNKTTWHNVGDTFGVAIHWFIASNAFGV